MSMLSVFMHVLPYMLIHKALISQAARMFNVDMSARDETLDPCMPLHRFRLLKLLTDLDICP